MQTVYAQLMLLAALRDLQWRRKRVVMTLVGTALVFAMSLLMSGLANSFPVEANRTLNHQRADYWVSPAGEPGPFAGGINVTPELVAEVAATPGVERANPVLVSRITTTIEGLATPLNLLGVVPQGLGSPPSVLNSKSGSPSPTPGHVVVPEKLGKKVGDTMTLGAATFTVSGIVPKASMLAGQSTVFVTLDDAQRIALGGAKRASMILVSTVANATPVFPKTVTAFDRSAARGDLLRPLKNATQSIDFIKFLLWAVAALIVASVVYLTTLERNRDIAVFKATGVPTSAIGAGICLQAVIIAVTSSIIGALLALLLAPNFPMDVVISKSSLLTLPVLAVIVGVLAGLIGVRRTAGIDPAAAFGGP
jgi:putative ABC transport system permease protein